MSKTIVIPDADTVWTDYSVRLNSPPTVVMDSFANLEAAINWARKQGGHLSVWEQTEWWVDGKRHHFHREVSHVS